MTGPDLPPGLAALADWLDAAARDGRRPTYGEAAAALELPPPRIRRLADGLEALMAVEAAEGAPFRAAVLAGRLREGLPAPGFFQAARALGRYRGPDEGPEAETWHAAELARLRAALGG